MNTASKEASCNDLRPWIKSIALHFWWARSSCERDAQIFREKWLSIIFSFKIFTNVPDLLNFIYMCCHALLSTEKQRKKNWLSPTSESFKALQDIVFSNSILKDLPYLTKFSHTGTLEVYHSLYNRWLQKSIHFSFHGMIARTQLAFLGFSSGSNLTKAATRKVKNDTILVSVK